MRPWIRALISSGVDSETTHVVAVLDCLHRATPPARSRFVQTIEALRAGTPSYSNSETITSEHKTQTTPLGFCETLHLSKGFEDLGEEKSHSGCDWSLSFPEQER